MEKRFQVFISSTYEDLTAEREAVSLAVLRSHNIPSGMELSSGANERTLDIIYRWIDDCDIFLLLLGGRYGSIDEASGLSYTELEYNYAKAHRKPVIALPLTDRCLKEKIARGATTAGAAYEHENRDKLAKFKERVTGTSFCIPISDTGALEAKILAALESVRLSSSSGGWIRTTAVLDDLLDLYARYTNCYLDIVRNDVFASREVEDLLRAANEVVRSFVCADLGWIDVMVPVMPVRADIPNLLLKNVESEPGWLKMMFSGVRRTMPPTLIPIEVNGIPWRGSGNAFMCGGIDYVSSFRNRYTQAHYGLSSDVAQRMEAQYAYWRREHYFSALLAIAILAPRKGAVRSIGVLNLNFSVEDPLGVDDTLSPQRSITIGNVLEPTLQVLAQAIERQSHRKWRQG
jgi:hypothetical protein